MPAVTRDTNMTPESHGCAYHCLGRVSEVLQEALFFPHCYNCQMICLNHYLKFLSWPNLFPELLTRNKMCLLEVHFLSFPCLHLLGHQWIMKWLWSGSTERRKESRTCQACECWRIELVWHNFSKTHNPWNNWYLFQSTIHFTALWYFYSWAMCF
jgi:hypothetical protein